jgi:hypothetical protein
MNLEVGFAVFAILRFDPTPKARLSSITVNVFDPTPMMVEVIEVPINKPWTKSFTAAFISGIMAFISGIIVFICGTIVFACQSTYASASSRNVPGLFRVGVGVGAVVNVILIVIKLLLVYQM